MSDTLTRATGIVFDLDGTLVDSTYVHTICWWEAIAQFGHERPMAVVHHAVGMGAGHLLEHVLGDVRDPGQDAAMSAAHDALFATWHERLHPFPAARSLLNWCRDAKLTVALATSSSSRDLWAMLDVLDHPDFDVVVTTDEARGSQAGGGLLESVLDRTGLEPEDLLVVGDSVWDMRAATRIGAPALGVATGGTSAPELHEAGAELTYPDLTALQRAMQDARAEALPPGYIP
ncbi:HAD family hydrolase [Pedococcus aerophilus]|uniref:HAD family hydrolase n=1 Tax=Pedococcus aerophilus TaxID=436356 RepID=A0ABN3URH1_9MICO